MNLRRRHFKFLLYAACIAACLYAFNNTQITDAALNFLLGGIVPGTGQVLEPDVVMTGAAAAIGLIVVASLTAVLIRSIRVRHARLAALTSPASGEQIIFARRPEAVAAHAAGSKKSTAKKALAPKLATKTQAKAKATSKTKVRAGGKQSTFQTLLTRGKLNLAALFRLSGYAVIVAVTFAGKILRRAARRVGQLVLVLDRVVTRLARSARRAARFAGITALKLTAAAFVTVGLAYAAAVAAIKRFWVWLEPRAAAFDTWLELRCRAAVAWSGRKLRRFEIIQVLLAISRSAKANIRHLFKTYL